MENHLSIKHYSKFSDLLYSFFSQLTPTNQTFCVICCCYMYLYCLDCDVKVTIMWIKFEKKTQNKSNDQWHNVTYFSDNYSGNTENQAPVLLSNNHIPSLSDLWFSLFTINTQNQNKTNDTYFFLADDKKIILDRRQKQIITDDRISLAPL